MKNKLLSIPLLYSILLSCNLKNDRKIEMDVEKEVNFYLVDSNSIKLGTTEKFTFDTTYFDNGNIQGIKTVIGGVENGYSIRFFESGVIKYINFSINGLWSGEQIERNEEGNVYYRGYYKADNPDSIQCYFYNNGKLKSRYYLQNGKQFGGQYDYYQNGKIKTFFFCDMNANAIYSNEYDTLNNLIKKEGRTIAYFAVNNKRYSNKFKIGDTCRLTFIPIIPPNTIAEVIISNEEGLYPPYTLTDFPLDYSGVGFRYLIRKKGTYKFIADYTLTDTLKKEKTESSKMLNIVVSE